MADGKPLQYKYTKSSGEEVTVEWFLSAYDGPERGSSASINVDVNTLYFYDDQNKAQYIYPKADTNGDWWVDANQITATSFGDGFNNIEIQPIWTVVSVLLIVDTNSQPYLLTNGVQ